MEKPYLTLDEIATTLDLTVETVRGYTKLKKNPLPAYRLGREYRVKKTDFDKWMAKRKNVEEEQDPDENNPQ